MKILAVDDEALGLSALVKAIEKTLPEAEIAAFHSPTEAISYAKKNEIFAACLDIQMPEMLGSELAKKLKTINPAIYIIFTTGYDRYMSDAFSLHASGYVLKPITPAKIKREFDNIKSLGEAYLKQISDSGKILKCQCFGNFEAFHDASPIHFKYDRTKELLAYLVSRRGALCSNGEIIAYLFEDDENHDSYLRGLRKDLVDTFAALKCENMIVLQRGKMGIVTENIECDYYGFLEGDAAAINSYRGEFMAQYSWGEFIKSELTKD